MPEPDFVPADQFVIDDLATLKMFSDPLRSRMIALMIIQPQSVTQLADRLQVPFTRLYYHIRLLEKHHLIRLVEKRIVLGGVEEKFFRAAALSYIVSSELSGVSASDGHNTLLEELLAKVLDSAKENIRASARAGLIDLSISTPDARTLLIRQGIADLTPQRAEEFQRRLIGLILEFLNPESPDTVSPLDKHFYEFAIAMYPLVSTSATPQRDQSE